MMFYLEAYFRDYTWSTFGQYSCVSCANVYCGMSFSGSLGWFDMVMSGGSTRRGISYVGGSTQ